MRALLIPILIYLIVGSVRNMMKQAYLFNQNKLQKPNDSIEFFQYTIKQPSFGDVLFFPVQLLQLVLVLCILALFNLFSFLLK